MSVSYNKLLFPELDEFEYDFDAKETKTVDEFFSNKKGICYDFVNYIYHKNANAKCYFIYTNKNNNTHTFALINDVWVEYAWIAHKGEHKNFNYKKIVDLFCEENNCDKSTILLLEYKPNNKKQTIEEFCNDRFKQRNDISLENYNPRLFSIESKTNNNKKYRYNNKRQITGRRRFKCTDCGQRFAEFEQLVKHASKMHKDEIGDEDVYKYLYEQRNPGPYICPICKKNPREWNPEKRKYNRICSSEKCKEISRKNFQKNMKRVYGTDNLLNDPEHQAAMLANRSISGKFKFPDGVEITYVGKYELDFLQYIVNKYNFDSTNIVDCPPSLYIKYYDIYTEKERYYIPDFFFPAYNLVVEIKDGSKYPVDSKAKAKLKEQAVIKANKFNYIKIVDKDYTDFDSFIETCNNKSYSEEKTTNEFIFIIPEEKI